MLPKSGNHLPNGSERPTERDYIQAISQALKSELGGAGNAAKSIQRWTGASNRTARNWLSATAGPSGPHLLAMARESDAVLAAILALAGRPELVLAVDLHAVEVALAKASGAFEVLRRQKARTHRE